MESKRGGTKLEEDRRIQNKQRFKDLLLETKREGMEDLLAWLETETDFFEAPASSSPKYHDAEPGGLCQHSLNVYDCLEQKLRQPLWRKAFIKTGVTEATLRISALLHDICKVNQYVLSPKNQKTYDPEKVAAAPEKMRKTDGNGVFIWETVMGYQIEDKLPLGHGEKSVILAMDHIKLTDAEKHAIRWHMGFTEDGVKFRLGEVYRTRPIAWAIHEADMEATYLSGYLADTQASS